jgi:uncharacterized membrane protein
MIQPGLSLKSLKAEKIRRLFDEPYLTVNVVFAGLILLIIGYSAVFSPEDNNYPIVCIHERLTGLPCASCGLSHSFSYIIRGNLKEAYEWNIYGLRVFLFFFAQLFMRIIFSVIYISNLSNRKNLIIFDITGSIIIFLISFYPFIRQLFMGVY